MSSTNNGDLSNLHNNNNNNNNSSIAAIDQIA